MLNLKEYGVKCTGCFLCADICPTKAIKMQLDEEGFFKYIIDESKCIKCGLCVKKCPKLKYSSNNNKISSSNCYSAYSKDDEILLNSSSGGIFSEISNFILNFNGVVIGAAYINNSVRHILIEKKEDLKLLRGSKYLQSDLTGIYNIVKDNLKQNKKVLFSGTPCQIAALTNFIQDENLYTIDIVCHGVPSKKVYDFMLLECFNSKVSKVEFRKKTNSWRNFNIKYDNKIISKDEDKWFKEFLNNTNLKQDCYNCPFVSDKRLGDITLADFWGIQDIDLDFYNLNRDRGVSAIMINSKKGKYLFEGIKENIIYKEQDLNKLIKYNPRIDNPRYDDIFLDNRKIFFEKFNAGKITFKRTIDIKKIIKKFVKKIIGR